MAKLKPRTRNTRTTKVTKRNTKKKQSLYQRSFLSNLSRPVLFALVFGLIGLGAVVATQAASILTGSDFRVYYATEDSFVRSDKPTLTNGESARLEVRRETGDCTTPVDTCNPRDNTGDEHTYVKFNVSAVPAGKRVSRVILRMRTAAGDGASPEGGKLYVAQNNTWTEAGLAWRNAPGAETVELARLGATRHDKWYNFEFNMANNPVSVGGTYSFVINSNNQNQSVWQSSETVNRPSLLVFYENIPTQVSHNENCTPGTTGTHGPCIDRAYITPPATGASNQRFEFCDPVPNPSDYCSDGIGEPSSFRTQCRYSHMNNDDAVLFKNDPGKAHLHTYYGNTGSNAFSTSQSLKTTGNSTCRGGTFNRSAYWVPTMVNGTNGRPLSMNGRNTVYPDLEAYYKLGYQGVSHTATQPFPDGLQLIAGNSSTATGPNTALNPPVVYYCDGQSDGRRIQGPEQLYIPACPVGHAVTMHIKFPQCWNGDLTSTNGRSHMTYGNSNPVLGPLGCPPSHPTAFPFVEMLVRYQVQAGEDSSRWRLASDKYTDPRGGFSGHADYIFAWDESAFGDPYPNDTYVDDRDPQQPVTRPKEGVIKRCHNAQRDCHYQLGDGRLPAW